MDFPVTLAKALRLTAGGRLFPSDYDMPIAFTAVGAMTSEKIGKSRLEYKPPAGSHSPHFMVYVPREQYSQRPAAI